jgi:hypothetical protein
VTKKKVLDQCHQLKKDGKLERFNFENNFALVCLFLDRCKFAKVHAKISLLGAALKKAKRTKSL